MEVQHILIKTRRKFLKGHHFKRNRTGSIVAKTLQQLAGQIKMQRVKACRLQLKVNELINRPDNCAFLPYKNYAVKGSKKKERNIY